MSLPDLLKILQAFSGDAGRAHDHAADRLDAEPEIEPPFLFRRELKHLIDGGHVGAHGRTLVRDGGDDLGLAAGRIADPGALRDGQGIDLAIHHRKPRLLAALVAGDDLTFHLQRFAGDGRIVAEIVDPAVGRELELHVHRDQVLQGVRIFRVHQEEMRFLGDATEDRQLGHVERDASALGELCHDHAFAVEHLHGEAVRLGPHELVERRRAAATGLVLNYDGRAGEFLEMRRQHARVRIVAAAGRIADNEVHGLPLQECAGVLRPGRGGLKRRGPSQQQCKRRERAAIDVTMMATACHWFPPRLGPTLSLPILPDDRANVQTNARINSFHPKPQE